MYCFFYFKDLYLFIPWKDKKEKSKSIGNTNNGLLENKMDGHACISFLSKHNKLTQIEWLITAHIGQHIFLFISLAQHSWSLLTLKSSYQLNDFLSEAQDSCPSSCLLFQRQISVPCECLTEVSVVSLTVVQELLLVPKGDPRNITEELFLNCGAGEDS